MRCVKTESALKNVGNQAQSVGGGGSPLARRTSRSIPTAAKSDCAEDSSVSRGLV